MKVYTITDIQSNICEVNTFAFIDYKKALIKWYELYEKYQKDMQTAMLDGIDTNEEEFVLDPEHKHLSYDDGTYYCSLDFDTHEVEQ